MFFGSNFQAFLIIVGFMFSMGIALMRMLVSTVLSSVIRIGSLITPTSSDRPIMNNAFVFSLALLTCQSVVVLLREKKLAVVFRVGLSVEIN